MFIFKTVTIVIDETRFNDIINTGVAKKYKILNINQSIDFTC